LNLRVESELKWGDPGQANAALTSAVNGGSKLSIWLGLKMKNMSARVVGSEEEEAAGRG
jgi:hypothetical protein